MTKKFITERKFSEFLREKDTELLSRLEYIRKRGLEEWVALFGFQEGAHRGYPHLLNVERNADAMIPDSMKAEFSSGEIFLLLCAIFLHDIGKLIKEKGHHIESKKIIEQCWAELGLPNERIAYYCAVISYSHCVEDPTNPTQIAQDGINILEYQTASLAPYGPLRIPFLAAILRISDEAENCWTRSLQGYLYKRIQKTGVNMIKGVRRFIEDIEFCHQGQCIILHIPGIVEFQQKKMESKNSDDRDLAKQLFILQQDEIEILNNMRDNIFKVLNNWSTILEAQNIRFKNVYFSYKNNLLYELRHDDNDGICFNKFARVIEPDAVGEQSRVKRLIDALIDLSRGCLGFTTFNWFSLEAKIGYALTDYDRWLLERINYISADLKVAFLPDDQIKIHFNQKTKKETLYGQLGIQS